MQEFDVVVGFSLNPEVTWHNIEHVDDGDQKLVAEADFHLSGTSFDVALALKRCGCGVKLVGALGRQDPLNHVIRAALGSEEIDHEILEVREKTCFASVEPDTGRRLSFKSPVLDFADAEVQDALNGSGASFRVVTGLMPDANEVRLAKLLLAKNNGTRILNPRQALTEDRSYFEELAQFTDWLFLNRREAAAYLGCDLSALASPDSVKPFLDLGIDKVIVTRDEEGVLLVDADGLIVNLECYPIDSKVDEVGAGDCFLAFLLAFLIKGGDLSSAAEFATIAAGLKVARMGTTNFPSYQEVSDEMVRVV